MKTDKKPQRKTQAAIEALVTGPGAVLYMPQLRGEFVLARVEFGKDEQGRFMKWVGINPETGHDIHWTGYKRLDSVGDYLFLLGNDDEPIAEVSTLEEAPYTDAEVLRGRLEKWRHILTLHNNQRNFDEFFDNE